MTRHKQRNFVNHDRSVFFQVDEEIYTLISAIYKLGGTTLYSCQGDDFEVTEIDSENFMSKAGEVKKSRAYVMLEYDDAAAKLLQLFVTYFTQHRLPHVFWNIEVDHHPGQGSRVIFRFPKDEILDFTWYLHDSMQVNVNPVIKNLRSLLHGIKAQTAKV